MSEGESIFWSRMDNEEMLKAIKYAKETGNEKMAESGIAWFRYFRLPHIGNPLGYEDWA